MSAPTVAVVVPVFNKIRLTRRFLESFRNVRYSNYRIVIVDDRSSDGTREILGKEFPEATVLPGSGNLWWAGGTNVGVRFALRNGFDYVLTINNDSVVRPDFLDHLVGTAERRSRTIVGSRIHYMDDPEQIWTIGGRMDWRNGNIFQMRATPHSDGAAPSPAREVPTDILTGCGTLVPARCYRRIGVYDAVNFPQYHADSELVLRARKHGYDACVNLDAVVWNDTTSSTNVRRLYDLLFHKRSPYYWRPVVAAFVRYCPPRHMFHAVAHLALRALELVRSSFLRASRRVLAALGLRRSFSGTPSAP